MDASVANRMRVKRSARTSQPVRCNLCRAASVTLQYRAFDCPRHPESGSCRIEGSRRVTLKITDRVTEGHASACPGRAEARPSAATSPGMTSNFGLCKIVLLLDI